MYPAPPPKSSSQNAFCEKFRWDCRAVENFAGAASELRRTIRVALIMAVQISPRCWKTIPCQRRRASAGRHVLRKQNARCCPAPPKQHPPNLLIPDLRTRPCKARSAQLDGRDALPQHAPEPTTGASRPLGAPARKMRGAMLFFAQPAPFSSDRLRETANPAGINQLEPHQQDQKSLNRGQTGYCLKRSPTVAALEPSISAITP